jgi:hypothetical protein
LPSSILFTTLVYDPSINIPKPVHSVYFNYSYTVWRFKFIINVLICFYSTLTIVVCCPCIFLNIFLSCIIKTLNYSKMDTACFTQLQRLCISAVTRSLGSLPDGHPTKGFLPQALIPK